MESTITLSEAKARFSEVVERVVNGEDFVVTRMGRAAVRISRFEARKRPRRLGDLARQIRIADDFEDWPPDIHAALGMARPMPAFRCTTAIRSTGCSWRRPSWPT